MPLRLGVQKCLILLPVLFLCLSTSGCPAAEEAAIAAQLQTALSNLEQNRSLTEQFVRDLKASADHSDPAFAEAMESYQHARECNDQYLDAVETNGHSRTSRSLRLSEPSQVRNAAADFLADATSILKPTVNTRRIPFQRVIVVPEDLQSTLQKLPKKARNKLIDQFDDQIRWRSWGQL